MECTKQNNIFPNRNYKLPKCRTRNSEQLIRPQVPYTQWISDNIIMNIFMAILLFNHFPAAFSKPINDILKSNNVDPLTKLFGNPLGGKNTLSDGFLNLPYTNDVYDDHDDIPYTNEVNSDDEVGKAVDDIMVFSQSTEKRSTATETTTHFETTKTSNHQTTSNYGITNSNTGTTNETSTNTMVVDINNKIPTTPEISSTTESNSRSNGKATQSATVPKYNNASAEGKNVVAEESSSNQEKLLHKNKESSTGVEVPQKENNKTFTGNETKPDNFKTEGSSQKSALESENQKMSNSTLTKESSSSKETTMDAAEVHEKPYLIQKNKTLSKPMSTDKPQIGTDSPNNSNETHTESNRNKSQNSQGKKENSKLLEKKFGPDETGNVKKDVPSLISNGTISKLIGTKDLANQINSGASGRDLNIAALSGKSEGTNLAQNNTNQISNALEKDRNIATVSAKNNGTNQAINKTDQIPQGLENNRSYPAGSGKNNGTNFAGKVPAAFGRNNGINFAENIPATSGKNNDTNLTTNKAALERDPSTSRVSSNKNDTNHAVNKTDLIPNASENNENIPAGTAKNNGTNIAENVPAASERNSGTDFSGNIPATSGKNNSTNLAANNTARTSTASSKNNNTNHAIHKTDQISHTTENNGNIPGGSGKNNGTNFTGNVPAASGNNGGTKYAGNIPAGPGKDNGTDLAANNTALAKDPSTSTVSSKNNDTNYAVNKTEQIPYPNRNIPAGSGKNNGTTLAKNVSAASGSNSGTNSAGNIPAASGKNNHAVNKTDRIPHGSENNKRIPVVSGKNNGTNIAGNVPAASGRHSSTNFTGNVPAVYGKNNGTNHSENKADQIQLASEKNKDISAGYRKSNGTNFSDEEKRIQNIPHTNNANEELLAKKNSTKLPKKISANIESTSESKFTRKGMTEDGSVTTEMIEKASLEQKTEKRTTPTVTDNSSSSLFSTESAPSTEEMQKIAHSIYDNKNLSKPNSIDKPLVPVNPKIHSSTESTISSGQFTTASKLIEATSPEIKKLEKSTFKSKNVKLTTPLVIDEKPFLLSSKKSTTHSPTESKNIHYETSDKFIPSAPTPKVTEHVTSENEHSTQFVLNNENSSKNITEDNKDECENTLGGVLGSALHYGALGGSAGAMGALLPQILKMIKDLFKKDGGDDANKKNDENKDGDGDQNQQDNADENQNFLEKEFSEAEDNIANKINDKIDDIENTVMDSITGKLTEVQDAVMTDLKSQVLYGKGNILQNMKSALVGSENNVFQNVKGRLIEAKDSLVEEAKTSFKSTVDKNEEIGKILNKDDKDKIRLNKGGFNENLKTNVQLLFINEKARSRRTSWPSTRNDFLGKDSSEENSGKNQPTNGTKVHPTHSIDNNDIENNTNDTKASSSNSKSFDPLNTEENENIKNVDSDINAYPYNIGKKCILENKINGTTDNTSNLKENDITKNIANDTNVALCSSEDKENSNNETTPKNVPTRSNIRIDAPSVITKTCFQCI